MTSYITEFLNNPREMLVLFLLAFPGRVLALSLHEFAHAWVANRCGDPTAKLMGRMTVNPLKHLDPLGTILMLLVGFGWAKPVPVDPRNYRDYRRDDLKVSVAGVTMNLIMFLLSMALMTVIAGFALSRIPQGNLLTSNVAVYRMTYLGKDALIYTADSTYIHVDQLLRNLPYAGEYLVAPVFGTLPGYLYRMLGYFSITNLALCVFNLVPVPPLDGYHVLNDLILKGKRLFASPQAARIASTLLFVAAMTGLLGKALGWVDTQVMNGVGSLAAAVLRAFGLMT